MHTRAQTNTHSKPYKYTIKTYHADTLERLLEDSTYETLIAGGGTDTIFEAADVMPEFVGGEKALRAFITQNLTYPAAAAKKGISGKVIVKFTIDDQGEIWDVKAVKTPKDGHDLAREALRIVKRMPIWKPGYTNGKAVFVSINLPILFSLK